MSASTHGIRPLGMLAIGLAAAVGALLPGTLGVGRAAERRPAEIAVARAVLEDDAASLDLVLAWLRVEGGASRAHGRLSFVDEYVEGGLDAHAKVGAVYQLVITGDGGCGAVEVSGILQDEVPFSVIISPIEGASTCASRVGEDGRRTNVRYDGTLAWSLRIGVDERSGRAHGHLDYLKRVGDPG